MHEVLIKDASSQLDKLIFEVASGEDVIIKNDSGEQYRIVAVKDTGKHPKFGSAKGLIKMSDDFDAPLNDFKEYML